MRRLVLGTAVAFLLGGTVRNTESVFVATAGHEHEYGLVQIVDGFPRTVEVGPAFRTGRP